MFRWIVVAAAVALLTAPTAHADDAAYIADLQARGV